MNISTINEQLKKIRISKGITQAQIAKILNIGQTNYSLIEKGKTPITVERLRIIADFLEVPISYFFTGGEEIIQNTNDVKKINELKNRIKELESILKDKEYIIELLKDVELNNTKYTVMLYLYMLTDEDGQRIINDDELLSYLNENKEKIKLMLDKGLLPQYLEKDLKKYNLMT
jgi:transcriptional regulator with XRE-family HTH domain